MADNNISITFDGFYVDDGRIVMFSIRAGWRWCDGSLWFCEDWAEEDKHKSPTERTKDVIKESLGEPSGVPQLHSGDS